MIKNRADFRDKNVHIIGMARSGLAAAEVLRSLEARVTIHDAKDASQLAEAMEFAASLGAVTKVGSLAYEGLADADLVVTSPGVPETSAGIVTARNAGIEIVPEIELAYRISDAPIIAVTGTNGKTTTTALIGEMVRSSGRKAFIAGNIAAGDMRLPLVKAAFEAHSSDVIAAEISSFQLELISSFRPKVAALLNIADDHFDRYADWDSYACAKERIFEYQTSSDFAVVNADDSASMRFSASAKSKVWEFSRTREVEVGTFTRGTEVWLRKDGEERRVCDTSTMKLRGNHNVENVLAAAAAVLAFGIEPEAIQAAVDRFPAPEHRLEPVTEIEGVEFLNNSMCSNVIAAVRSLEAIGRPAIVIAGGKDKGLDYGPLGEAFARHAKHVVLIGRDAGLLEDAAKAAGFNRLSRAGTMEEAVEDAWRRSEAGDTVLLSPACASFDMFKDFEDRGRVFKAAVMALAERENH